MGFDYPNFLIAVSEQTQDPKSLEKGGTTVHVCTCSKMTALLECLQLFAIM